MLNRLKLRIVLPLLALVFFVASIRTQAADDQLLPVRTVPVPALQDIAVASFDQFGPVIYYNPFKTQQAGPAFASFTYIHEYAHVVKGHVTKIMMAADPYARIEISRAAEIEADKYATDYWAKKDMSVVQGAIAFFEASSFSNLGDLTHLPAYVRAQNIRRWAGGGGGTGGRKCAECSGKGYVYTEDICPVTECIDGKVDCQRCDGTGERVTASGDTRDCFACKGEGTVNCRKCRGKGDVKVREKCADCDGTGRSEDEEEE